MNFIGQENVGHNPETLVVHEAPYDRVVKVAHVSSLATLNRVFWSYDVTVSSTTGFPTDLSGGPAEIFLPAGADLWAFPEGDPGSSMLAIMVGQRH